MSTAPGLYDSAASVSGLSWITWTTIAHNTVMAPCNVMAVIKWKHFPHYWPFVRGIHRSPVNSPHKGQWGGALMFFYLRLNKWLSKQLWGWWFETPSCSLWRHCNVIALHHCYLPHPQWQAVEWLLRIWIQKGQNCSTGCRDEAWIYLLDKIIFITK